MEKIYTFVLCIASCISLIAQEDSNYFITTTNGEHYLIHGTSFLINTPENACYEYIEGSSLAVGEKFIIIHVRDEMENDRGVIIFDKKGKQINYDVVQNERKKHYKPYNCCVNVQELNGILYFWDIIEPFEDGKNYDCYYDSQTDASMYLIPRYYIFEPETGSVETKILKNKCTILIQDGKIICD